MTDDLWNSDISPMLMYEEKEPFDSAEHIFELKLDGARCLMYLDSNGTQLKNKRCKDVSELYPELMSAHKQAKKRCILDGELIALKDGKPDFYSLQRRALGSGGFKARLAATNNPVYFVAYDILYVGESRVTSLPQMERKNLLSKTLAESATLSISRYTDREGIALFALTKAQGLEGVVAKRKDGRYFIGKRTREWVKIKVMQDEDLVVAGFTRDENGAVKDLILALPQPDGTLRRRGKVYLGVSESDRREVERFSKSHTVSEPWFDGYPNAVWIEPQLVGTAHYMQKTEHGTMRQPVFKGLKLD